MAPPVQSFSAERLPSHVNIVQHNFIQKKRKGPQIELEKCPLMEMMQYSCNPPSKGAPEAGRIVCKPVLRLFRRCADGVTVETTSWEPIREQQAKQKKASASK
ncbi:hypothetical protein N7470_005421 [Penicillium chermesinum]|nr:hypothetical protein N7470_005421 [Penicillium chermesinum]